MIAPTGSVLSQLLLIGESLSNDIEAAELQNWYRWRAVPSTRAMGLDWSGK